MRLHNNRGNALIVAYLIGALMIIIVSSIIVISANEYGMALRNLASVKMLYLAEGGTEMMANSLAVAVSNYQSEPSGGDDVWGLVSGQAPDFLSTGYTLDFTCQSSGIEYQSVSMGGIVTFKRNYKLLSIVTDPGTGRTITINQIVSRDKTYTFQHAVLYTEDLEILPGPDMELSGKVHTNQDLYIDSNGHTLTVASDYLKAAGDIFKKRKDSGNELFGDVDIMDSFGDYRGIREVGDETPMDSDNDNWVNGAIERWGGTVESGEHGVTALSAPEVASIQADGFYADNADVMVVDGVLSKGGSVLVEGVDVPVGTVTTDTTFYDNREGKYCKNATIDLRKLAGWEYVLDADGNPVLDADGNPLEVQNFANNMPENGLLYATRSDNDADELPAIRLLNGSEIDSSVGLTVVSNLPVYVQGDYNTVNKTKAAVICDAINILSNSWDDSNSTSDLSSRIAGDTTVNAAFISGVVPTVGSNYSGGLENLPRMHEKWSNKTLFIRGSFIVLWESQFATAEWSYGGDIYKAPGRNWDYDIDFNDSENLPPFTPYAVKTTRVAWWR